MAITLNQNTDCCETTCDATSTVNIAGPTGAAGAAGTNGTNGSNAYTATTASFIMPAVSSTVVVAVSDSVWMSVGQTLYVSGGGYFEVTAKASATSITVKNLLTVPTNAAVGATVATASTVSSAGVKGDTGAAGAAGSGLQTLAKGGLSTYSTQNIALAVGADGKFLGADSSATAGIAWDTVKYSDLQASTLALDTVTTSGQLPLVGIANAGGVAGDIAYWNGTVWVKLPKGSTGQRLEQGASAPQWVTPAVSGVTMEAYGRVTTTTSHSDAPVFDGDEFNCASVAASGNLVTVVFTNVLSKSKPIVLLTPRLGATSDLTLDANGISTASIKIELPDSSAPHEFDFAVFV
jgi:hypothetical protein